MNVKQVNLAFLIFLLFAATLFFAPWPVDDRFDGTGMPGFTLSPLWQPVPYDENGYRLPILLAPLWFSLMIFHLCLHRLLRTPR